jgi:glucokinase
MEKEIVLAADLGGTNLRMAAIDRDGRILYRSKRETPRADSADEIVRAIVESAAECRENSFGFHIKAISAAVPATVDAGRGLIVTAPNLPALNDFPIVEALEKELGYEAILENDANAAALGENWLGASKDVKNSIFLTLGTGVGGGIITDGRILRGAGGMAGEIGHLSVEANGAPCRCGSFGCVEQYASASAIVRLARELAAEYPESSLPGNDRLTAFDIFEAGTSGDELALEVFRRMGFYLGVAVTSLINVLNPEIVVIGGGASAGWDLFMPHMRETICRRAYGGQKEQARILRGQLGDDAGILGAARLAFEAEA